MKTVRKQYVIGFMLICLVGVGLLIGGVARYFGKSDMIETEATVVKVFVRTGDNGDLEYRPTLLQYYVDGVMYETSLLTWFSYPIHSGDTMYIRYKKDDPTDIIVSNADRNSISFALMGIGGVLIVAGLGLTVKYLYDVKRRKDV